MIIDPSLEPRLIHVARTALCASRRDADVSQQELAARLGWTRNMVANMEGGRRQIRFVDFLLISKALAVNPVTLLDRVIRW